MSPALLVLMCLGAVKAGCEYEGSDYSTGQVVWQSQDCECTQMMCEEDGKVHLVEKGKPCCLYRGKAYGSGEILPGQESQCYQLICYKGEVISLPYCPEGFHILTYNNVASCYHVSSEPYTWYEAAKYCHYKGSSLAVISTPEENQAVENYLFHNPLHSGCKYGWLGGSSLGYNVTTTTTGRRRRRSVSSPSPNYSNGYINWNFGILAGLPVSSIYDDFPSNTGCRGRNLSGNLFLEILYTGSLGSNNYVWGCEEPDQLKLAICEKCVACEHKYQNKCLDCGEVYEDGEIIETDSHCYKVACLNGKAEKTMVKCPNIAVTEGSGGQMN